MKTLVQLILALCMAAMPIIAPAQEFSKLQPVPHEQKALRKSLAERAQSLLQEAGVRSDAPASAKQLVVFRADKDSVTPGREIVLDMLVTDYLPEIPRFYGVVFTPSPETGQAAYGLQRFPIQLDSSEVAQTAPGLAPGLYRAAARIATRPGDIKGDYVFDVATVSPRTGIRMTEDVYMYVHVGTIGQFGRPYFHADNPVADGLMTLEQVIVRIPGKYPPQFPMMLATLVDDGTQLRYYTLKSVVVGVRGEVFASIDRAQLKAIGRSVHVSFIIYEDQLSTSMWADINIEP